MKEYRLWQLVLYPSLQVMSGFAMMRHFGTAWDSVLVFVYFVFLAIMTALYILLGTLVQVLQVMNWNAPEPKKEYVNQPIKNLNAFSLQR